MKFNTKSPLFLITFGVLLFAAVMNLPMVLQFLQSVLSLVFPVVIGLLFAFVLNVPMRGFERLLKNLAVKMNKEISDQLLQKASLLLTLICIILVITIAWTMLIPALITSVKSISPLIRERWPEWLAILSSHEIDTSMITDWVNGIDFESLAGNAKHILGSAFSAASSTISLIMSGVFGMIIAIYVLSSKKILSRQSKKVVYANLKEETARRICEVAILVRDTFAKFLSGQCVEAIILGVLIFVSFSIFQIPYAGLIGFLTSLFAFIPYVGAFASCAIGVFLSLLVDPSKAVLCLVVYMVVQFVENQFIYPHVVGNSVGLMPIWTLIAALIGGKLFGVVGIIFAIPLTATLYVLIREDTNRKLAIKGTLSAQESE
ncbi:MAG: AI-2E family transporter [Erysipelotrichaceae bacterium]|nr:AI-2E family transporter [Erysipelotrichaceae bacterium]